MSEVRVMASVSVADAHLLAKEKRLYGIISMPVLDQRVIETVHKFMNKKVGFYENVPVTVLSKFNGKPAEISNVSTGIDEVFPVKSGAVLLDMGLPEDSIVSVSVPCLFSLNSKIKEATSAEEAEIYLEELTENLKVGDLQDEDDVISFAPYIDLNKCKFFALLTPSWDVGSMQLPGVQQVKLSHIDLFVK
jgi:hypothetical protein